jgi:hypothetical protein
MGRDAGQNKNAGADDGADAEARERHGSQDSAEPVLAMELFEEDVKGFSSEKRTGHFHLILNPLDLENRKRRL